MRLNEHIKLVGKKVILVPYEAKHVEKYHQWMSDPELQQLTASEPLTLEEEYEMQHSWRNDEDKCTFLVLCRETYTRSGGNEIEALVGDTNLFLRLEDDDDVEASETKTEKVAEAEIMIAEPTARGKGYGKEAMLLLLKYAQDKLAISKFEAKIGIDNTKSINMFQRMQFEEICRTEIFREVTLARKVTEQWIAWLDEQVTLTCESYTN